MRPVQGTVSMYGVPLNDGTRQRQEALTTAEFDILCTCSLRMKRKSRWTEMPIDCWASDG